jgi:hypothetical protein
MRIVASVFAVTAITSLTLPAFSAEAGKGGRGPHRLVRKLVKSGAITRAELEALRPAMKEARLCRKAVRAGSQAKGSCLPKFIAAKKSRLALLQGALGKVTEPKLKSRLERHIERMTKRIAKMEARAAQPAPQK